MAAAIVVDAAAFSLWNLAARSPQHLARDLAAGVRQPAVAVRGVLRFLAGVLLLFSGAVLLVPMSIQTSTFTVLETWTVLTGLLVEQLLAAKPR